MIEFLRYEPSQVANLGNPDLTKVLGILQGAASSLREMLADEPRPQYSPEALLAVEANAMDHFPFRVTASADLRLAAELFCRAAGKSERYSSPTAAFPFCTNLVGVIDGVQHHYPVLDALEAAIAHIKEPGN